jgi:hypothetical protein
MMEKQLDTCDEAHPLPATPPWSPKQSIKKKSKSNIPRDDEKNPENGGNMSIQERLFTK